MGLVGVVLGPSGGVIDGILSGSIPAFLIEGLSWSAFFLPAYLWVAAIIIFLPGFRRDLLFVLLASLAPFAVVAYLARILDAARVDSTVSGAMSLSAILTVVLLGVLALALSVLILALRKRLFVQASPESGFTSRTSRFESTPASPVSVVSERVSEVQEEALFVESGSVNEEPVDSGDSAYEGDRAEGFRLPPLPPALNLSSLDRPVLIGGPPAEGPPAEGLLAEVAEPQTDDAEDLAEEPGFLEELDGQQGEESGYSVDELESFAEEAKHLPLDEEPIPVLFGRNPEYNEDLPGTGSGEAPRVVPRPVTKPGRGALLPKVEVFADGTHTEALRETTATKTAGTSLPGLPRPSTRRLAKPLVPYTLPTEGILTAYPDGQYWIIDEKTRHAGEVLKETLKEFNIQAEVTGIRKGPVITMFEILPAPGVRLSKIATLSDNIALRLAASSVRIVAPIPGKHAVGIEVPNERRAIVSFKEIVESEVFKSAKMEVPVVLGKDISGDVQVVELTQTPHLLIAGATGSGKSVCVNSIILSILYKRSFNEVKLILIDPKIVELKLYNGIPHLLTPVITEPKKAFQALQYCICEMERRYSLLDAMGVRDIRSYNRKIAEKNMATDRLPYIVVIIDEFADLMATTGKELESTLARLAAMSRAVGIHLVLATQRPSIDVITGLIKANIPSRIAFMVAGKFDSRIIIDMVGAEKLLGRGDMLYSSATDAFPVRMQGAFVSEDEVERVVAHVKTLGEPDYIDDEIFIDEDDEDEGPSLFDEDEDDPLFEKALEIVLSQGKASASFLQRKLKIGYNRAARIVELMEEKGIVGKAQGSKPRDLVRNPEMGGPRPPNPKAKYTPDPDPVLDDDPDDYDEPEMADADEIDTDVADPDEPEAS